MRIRTPAVGIALALALTSVLVLALRWNSPSIVPRNLPNDERQLVEFLLLLPVAALLCCFLRVFVGLHTFGTFAPALLGLSFREVESVAGAFILLVVLSVGWLVRRGLAHLNLLQVPRSAVLLSVVVAVLLGYTLISNYRGHPVAKAIPFLPLVIVTAIVERFWTMEEEDGTAAAAKTMAATMLTAMSVFLLVQIDWVVHTLTVHPEVLGLVMAAQILLGRYTGYRLVELHRFRELAK